MLARGMDPTELDKLEQIVASGVPAESLAFFGRWWQLERWLREMAYFELRARYGVEWTAHLSPQATSRAGGDAINDYMATADSDDLLAYADVSVLFRLLEDHWDLFAGYLPGKRRWTGATDELRALRNRNAHCRRPHPDDVSRIEQTLRDVELGAWKVLRVICGRPPGSA
jgi:Swt1-like HEPN